MVGRRRRDRVIYQYRVERARRTLRGTGEQIARAGKAVAGQPRLSATGSPGRPAARTVNRALEAKAGALAGFLGYDTNLDPNQGRPPGVSLASATAVPDREVVPDIRTRLKGPSIHRYERDSLEAHLTIVFAAPGGQPAAGSERPPAGRSRNTCAPHAGTELTLACPLPD
jgi:hypothetical protein